MLQEANFCLIKLALAEFQMAPYYLYSALPLVQSIGNRVPLCP